MVWRACLAEKRNANEKQKDVSTDCRLFAGLRNKCVKVDNTLVDTAADGSLSITGKDVRGIWLADGAKLTANNVNFNDKGTANEVGLDSASKLIMKGGSIKVPGVAFTADGGSTATTDGTTIETGVLASNSTIILKNSTTTGVALYAGAE